MTVKMIVCKDALSPILKTMKAQVRSLSISLRTKKQARKSSPTQILWGCQRGILSQ